EEDFDILKVFFIASGDGLPHSVVEPNAIEEYACK
ncbi:unnamed protein product, partial [Linum tenue]